MGQFELILGDAIEVMRSITPNSIDCIWTDPPYNLSNGGTTCRGGTRVKVDKGEWDKSRGVELDHQFHMEWLTAATKILKPNGTIWVSGTVHHYLSVGFAMQKLGLRILNDIIWHKKAPPPNLGCRCFTHATEILLWATPSSSSRQRYTFNYKQMREMNGGKQMQNVWKIGRTPQIEKQYGFHPTQKPLTLVERCLQACTQEDDLVFDPFLGSGTTGVAALKLGRRFIGCDTNEDYLKIAQHRLDPQPLYKQPTPATIERRGEIGNFLKLCRSDRTTQQIIDAFGDRASPGSIRGDLEALRRDGEIDVTKTKGNRSFLWRCSS